MPKKPLKGKRKKRKGTPIPAGPSIQVPVWNRKVGTGLATVEWPESSPGNAHPSEKEDRFPKSFDDIKIGPIPKDLRLTFHEDGRYTMPLDAKHRASNWPVIERGLKLNNAPPELTEAYAREIESRIRETLRKRGRVVKAKKRTLEAARSEIRSDVREIDREIQKASLQAEGQHPPDEPPPLAEVATELSPVEGRGNDAPSSGVQVLLGSLSLKQIFELAKDVRGHPIREQTVEGRRSRSQIVRAFAKAAAQGICQYCNRPAQYVDTDGTPRLHVHHIVHLEQGGEDSIENVVAICPNCHDIIHLRNDKADADLLKLKVRGKISNLV